MKHQDPSIAYLETLANSGGITLRTEQVEALVRYLKAVLAKNADVNLTRITELDEATRLHLYDSLLAVADVADAPPGDALDLGSGAGFPGVVLAVATGRRFDLLDSVGKKMRAVSACLGALGGLDPGIQARDERAEHLAVEVPGAYALVTARAVAPLPSLVELAAPLLCEGGHLVCLKGRLDLAELDSGAAVAALVGLAPLSVRRYRLPDGDEERAIVSYAKVAESQIRLPRRVGMAQKRPLA